MIQNILPGGKAAQTSFWYGIFSLLIILGFLAFFIGLNLWIWGSIIFDFCSFRAAMWAMFGSITGVWVGLWATYLIRKPNDPKNHKWVRLAIALSLFTSLFILFGLLCYVGWFILTGIAFLMYIAGFIDNHSNGSVTVRGQRWW